MKNFHHKIFLRKLNRLITRREIYDAKHLKQNKPEYTLDHLVRERYPTFADALHDIDDALCLLFLFANMPTKDKVHAGRIHACRKLCAEFMQYVIMSRSLRKTFLSIKGIYYQAEIKGQKITWVVPYEFTQRIPREVDFSIMSTFLEFYETLMGFVNFQLYHDLNLAYPPKFNAEKWREGGFLEAFEMSTQRPLGESATQKPMVPKKISSERMQSLATKLDQIQQQEGSSASDDDDDDAAMNSDTAGDALPEETNEDEDLAEFVEAAKQQQQASDGDQVEGNEAQLDVEALQALVASLPEAQIIFKDKVIYLSREVPRSSLVFVIRAFGGKVGWDSTVARGSPYEENDTRIQYQISDRPSLKHTVLGRTYVQPQWVYDSINFQKVLNPLLYAPGKELPPHLSPFVEYQEGDYVPEAAKMLVTGEVLEQTEDVVRSSEEDSAESSDEDGLDAELQAEAAGLSYGEYKAQQKESKAQPTSKQTITKAQVKSGSKNPSVTSSKKRTLAAQEEAEREQMLKSVMSSRQRHAYNRVQKKARHQTNAIGKLEKRKAQLDGEQKRSKKGAATRK
ncbi:mRNA-binding ribosome synthesis protein nop7 [Dispira parvispora]|uniref:mRNA-binding ribosome synthesis protein nop7 n=1 Tax=Dispira parvispora TaxID=1520584 RepID=A0A9W8E5F7_9FUNG|nr:mRNA-binding ribosome synthesis protein nop7 [Dispira parvispora]